MTLAEPDRTNPFAFTSAADAKVLVPTRRPIGVWLVVATLMLDLVSVFVWMKLWSRSLGAPGPPGLSTTYFVVFGKSLAVRLAPVLIAAPGLIRGRSLGWWAAVFHAQYRLCESLFGLVFIDLVRVTPIRDLGLRAYLLQYRLAYLLVFGLMLLYLNRAHVVSFCQVRLLNPVWANLQVFFGCVLLLLGLEIGAAILRMSI